MHPGAVSTARSFPDSPCLRAALTLADESVPWTCSFHPLVAPPTQRHALKNTPLSP